MNATATVPVQATPAAPKGPRSATAHAYWNASGDLFANLCGRWSDESEYEDFADYVKVMRENGEKHGVVVLAGHKRPMGATFLVDGWTFQSKMTARGEWSYKCVPNAKDQVFQFGANDWRAIVAGRVVAATWADKGAALAGLKTEQTRAAAKA